MHGRANVSLWAREEDGSYQAEKDGWKLHVSWTPEPHKGGPWGFRWVAEGPEGKKVEAPELLEEIEVAMMTAEYVAGHSGELPPPPLRERAANRGFGRVGCLDPEHVGDAGQLDQRGVGQQ